MPFHPPPSEHLLRDILPDEMPASEYQYLRQQLLQGAALDQPAPAAGKTAAPTSSPLRWLWLKLAARA
ncbi:hypothetical protein [Vogesella oryzae]|uniref:hypothetical protein n=1 Tax=Vogesella oryzae TaxID=1735285 RepID=UPI0015825E3F|nr:hypothetical protein [Vogesella oryzae]